jgi:hypothetical protein
VCLLWDTLRRRSSPRVGHGHRHVLTGHCWRDGTDDVISQHVASWRRNLDLKAWGQEMRELERNLRKNQGEEDVRALPAILLPLSHVSHHPHPLPPLPRRTSISPPALSQAHPRSRGVDPYRVGDEGEKIRDNGKSQFPETAISSTRAVPAHLPPRRQPLSGAAAAGR